MPTMHHCEGDTLMRKNGLHGAYSKLEDRATNQAIRGEKKIVIFERELCNGRTDLVRRSEGEVAVSVKFLW